MDAIRHRIDRDLLANGSLASGKWHANFGPTLYSLLAQQPKLASLTIARHILTPWSSKLRTEHSGGVRSLEDYLEVRRDSAGVKISFAIGELHLHLPQEVIDHPVISRLTEIAVDLIMVANDIYSYKVEWERGDGAHNLVTVVIHQFGTDVQDAMNYIGNLNDYLVEESLAQRDHIPIFGGPVYLEIRAYSDMLGEWIRGNDSWSFEGGRYFGEEGPEI